MVRDSATLVLPPRLEPAVEAIAEGSARSTRRLVRASAGARPGSAPGASSGATSRSRPRPPRLSWAAAAPSVLAPPPGERVPGRLEVVGERPSTLLDVGPQPPRGGGARGRAARGDRRAAPARGRRQRARGQGRRRDARRAAPSLEGVVFTRSANPRALSPATLESLAPAARRAARGDRPATPARRSTGRAPGGPGRRGGGDGLRLPDRRPVRPRSEARASRSEWQDFGP